MMILIILKDVTFDMQHINAIWTTPGLYKKLCPMDKPSKNPNKITAYNNKIIFTFDTETTSIKIRDKKMGFVYIWQCCINGETFCGYTLNEFKFLLDTLCDHQPLNKIIVWVHNLSFEFQFLRNVLDFSEVFARTPRKPIFARYRTIEFRCTYMLTHLSLANLAKQFHTEHKKMVGDLDYEKIRIPGITPQTDKEKQYEENDVLVLYDFIKGQLEKENGKFKRIPYTQTGYVRRDMLQYLKDNKQYYAVRRIVKRAAPTDMKLFKMLVCAFWGGITHANYKAVLHGTYYNIPSYDKSSSYPHSMCTKKYPMTKFTEIRKNKFYYVDNPDFAWVGSVRFYDIESKTPNGIISKHKCTHIVPKVVDGKARIPDSNGRIVQAAEIELTLTDIDYQNIMDMYTVKRVEIGTMYVSRYAYLPIGIVNFILDLYSDKTTLKGVPDRESEYMYKKQNINSVYGCCVMNPYTEEIVYKNGEWLDPKPPEPEKLTEYYKNRKTVFLYQWGVWCTAHSRRELVRAMIKTGEDCLYTDTDSVKPQKNHAKDFANLNAEIHEENMRVCKERGISVFKMAPTDIKGKVHELGLWEYEYTAIRFKVLGCKRYLIKQWVQETTTGHYRGGHVLPGKVTVLCPELHATVAGVPKRAIENYCRQNGFESFRSHLCLTGRDTFKTQMQYIDDVHGDYEITDYMGNTAIVSVGYGIYAEPAPFQMDMPRDFVRFLSGGYVSEKKQYLQSIHI